MILDSFRKLFDSETHLPLFKSIDDTMLQKYIEDAIVSARQELDETIQSSQNSTFENTVVAMDRIGFSLHLISNLFYNLNHANTNETIQQTARAISPLITDFFNDIWLNEKLLFKVKEVWCQDNSNLSSDQTKLLNDTYKSFARRGALLNENQKSRYREMTIQLADLSLRFGENLLAETNGFELLITNNEDLAGLPDSVIQQAEKTAIQANKSGWIFTLHSPSYLPFMKYAENRALRKKMFLAYSKRGNQNNAHNNKKIINEIVLLRLELANLLGFETYADFVLDEQMAQSSERVNSFLNDLLKASLPFAKADVDEIATFASKLGLKDALQKWDFAFYSEKIKIQKYNVDDEIVKPYLPLEAVEKSIFNLANKLFGLTFEIRSQTASYHPEVKVFNVFNKDHQAIAILLLDYHARASKQGGAWMTSFKEQFIFEGKNERPIVSLVMNFSKAIGDTPALLTFQELRTFLHEFGHGLHGMLSQVNYISQSGTNVYRDFVELPSQLMENFATEPEWLSRVARHYQSGEVMPYELMMKLIECDRFQSGYATVRQLSFGFLDMAWHSLANKDVLEIDQFELFAISPTELLPRIDGALISTAFSHVFDGGYAAGYYGYKWAEVLDAHAFEKFKEDGVFNASVAKLYQRTILEKGGSDYPMNLYLAFRGCEPDVKALLRRDGLID